jgi:hypothetical protein
MCDSLVCLQTNFFVTSLLSHGVWVEHTGLLSSLPGMGEEHTPRLAMYVEVPAVHFWPSPSEC